VYPYSIAPTVRQGDQLSWSQLQRLSDEHQMAYLQEGRDDALAVFFDGYQKLVLGIALKIVRDPFEAEDVTHTVFLDFYRAVTQFDSSKGTNFAPAELDTHARFGSEQPLSSH
jgi:Sigma-70 region 2